ncbi:hypothetical protein [Anaeromyxobacter oryzae]|uniref:Lysozyme inhibitor LprI N-terminal domain-containing protein n=1 Tax=Anaeromyxobacter oryzae TaxID=2918170 RepID=A0ABM7X1Z1_9BACT|nr:hypothetical protein [Anaeromyxobacter oryzae]BDG05813.1 hypothetical protein AMOR_48090 [Anaeromyxobacter oryzae]
MRKAALAVALALGLPAAAPAKPAAARADAMTPEEKAFCASELEVVEKRTRVFQAQGLGAAEIDRRNEGPRQNLADCRRRFQSDQRRIAEEQEDLAEVDRRAGPTATEVERERVWRQLRRERLAGKSPASLTPEEKAELQAGVQEELAATHQTLDTVHARDPFFMRQVHSALACYHGDRREDLRAALSHEESLVKVGTGDRTRLYALRADLKQSEEVLARSREAARTLPDGLARCSEPQTAVLAHCLGIRFEGKKNEPACESEQIQQYIRFIK